MALVELLLSGCTTAADHHNLFPPSLESAIDIEVEEAKAVGLRMTVTRGSMGISEKDGGLQPDSIVQDSDAILRDSERVLNLYHEHRPGAFCASRSRPARRSPTPLRVLSGIRRARGAHDARLHCHLCQSPEEDAYAMQTFGNARSICWRTPAGLHPEPGSRTGCISTPTKSGGSGGPGSASPIWPSADMAFGVGICPAKDLEAAGVAVGLGVDGSASNNSSNLMEEARHALMLQRPRYGHAAVSPYDALRWATEG